MQYKIITAGNVSGLEKSVQNYVNNGWRPLGAPIFQAAGCCQAMTLEEKKSDASWEVDRLRAEGAYDEGRDGWL